MAWVGEAYVAGVGTSEEDQQWKVINLRKIKGRIRGIKHNIREMKGD